MATGTLGPVATGMPWRKLVVGVVILIVVGVPMGLGTAQTVEKDRQERHAGWRAECTRPVPQPVADTLMAQFTALDSRSPRVSDTDPALAGFGMVRSAEGQAAGRWFVSVELLLPNAPKEQVGDVATIVAPDDGTGTAPLLDPAQWQAVERNARAFAPAMAPTPADFFLTEDGAIESRFCAIDVTRPPDR